MADGSPPADLVVPSAVECAALAPSLDSVSPEERARAIEIAKYFSSASVVPGAEDAPLDEPRLSPDHTLTALAQLGAFKLDCDRSFISLIDRSHQYIIAEATKSTALEPRDKAIATDGVYLGFRALELSFGVCPQTMQIFTTEGMEVDTPNVTANNSRYIIRDFTADDHFKNRPYVTGYPHMRSYAEIPLTTPAGYVIGSYCVVDDKPRQFNDAEIESLAGVASTIMNHLDLMKSKLEFKRVERLVLGLGSYVAGHSGLKEQQTMPLLAGATSESTRGFQQELPQQSSDTGSIVSPQGRTSGPVSSTERSSSGDRPILSQNPSKAESAHESYTREQGFKEEFDDEQTGKTPSTTKSPVSRTVQIAFSRAGNLLRQCMDMQGVVFIDASVNGLANANAQNHNASQKSGTGRRPFRADCKILGSSKESETLTPGVTTTNPFRMSEGLLERMLARYPIGHIFSYDDMGLVRDSQTIHNNRDNEHPSRKGFVDSTVLDESSEEADALELFQVVERARSVFFLPMWDYSKARWYSGIIGWTTDPTRIFNSGDLLYLEAFANSISAEISRIESSAISSAKSDFISSISHELRSPLHGILAGTEILKDSVNTAEETSMLNSIDSCGRILLDTLDSLLDFAKLQNLTQKTRAMSLEGHTAVSEQSRGRSSVVDLGQLVQDVVEGVHLGYTSRMTKSNGSMDNGKSPTPPDENQNSPTGTSIVDCPPVLVDIDPSNDWSFQTDTGAWKRIVMNVVGNSLKYCKKGQIDVTLTWRPAVESRDTVWRTATSKQIVLIIRDTGRGMSVDFQRHKLFTPFSQENHLSVGTGLGLAIVHQLVGSLDGKINIESTLGVGSTVTIIIPVGEKTREARPKRPLDGLTRRSSLDAESRLRDHILYVCPPESGLGIEKDGVANQRALLTNIAENWLHMKIVTELPPLDHLEASSLNHFVLAYDPVAQGWTIRMEKFDGNGASEKYGSVKITQPLSPKKLANIFAQAISALRLPHTPMKEGAPDEAAKKVKLSGNDTEPMQISPKFATTTFRRKTPPEATSLPANPSPATNGEKKSEAPFNILLVDDNYINLKVLSSCIDKIGCNYTKASDGQKAVAAYEQSEKPFDMVFMDLSMPVMDGYEATRLIRKHEETNGLRRSRIIALTALGSSEAKSDAQRCGVDLFISKPVSMRDVKALVAAERLRLSPTEVVETVQKQTGTKSVSAGE